MKVYLDNAASTPISDDVFKAMLPILKEQYGNPSSVHSFGRSSKVIIENARKRVASIIGAVPSEIIFTTGGTEANNMVLRGVTRDLGVTDIITSRLEHPAVIKTLESFDNDSKIILHFVENDDKGVLNLKHFESILKKERGKKILVSLMHANNEIGNLLPIKQVSNLCKEYGALFHSDTVQTLGYCKMDVRKLGIDFVTCSAHKFHGPKGVGFLYVNEKVQISPLITGGGQERNMRAGTENIYGIEGLAKAMEMASLGMQENIEYISNLKNYMIKGLERIIPDIQFNGTTKEESLCTILNVRFPSSPISEMLIHKLDIEGIAVSGGSACSSGALKGSYVLSELGVDPSTPSIRFSFSKYNTKEEVDYIIGVIKKYFTE